MRPPFADPKNYFVFLKIFGAEPHKHLLVAFLNDVLELDEAHRIVDVTRLSPEQRPRVEGMQQAILGARCIDARGASFVMEMQVLQIDGFEKPMIEEVSKTFVGEARVGGQGAADRADVIGVSICDFELWPQASRPDVPMLSRWRVEEPDGGAQGFGPIELVFLELPKYDASRSPRTLVERWAYFFRFVGKLEKEPEVLTDAPFREAVEATRIARFTVDEWDAYIDVGIAIQDKRGALSLARKQGYEEGLREAQRERLR